MPDDLDDDDSILDIPDTPEVPLSEPGRPEPLRSEPLWSQPKSINLTEWIGPALLLACLGSCAIYFVVDMERTSERAREQARAAANYRPPSIDLACGHEGEYVAVPFTREFRVSVDPCSQWTAWIKKPEQAMNRFGCIPMDGEVEEQAWDVYKNQPALPKMASPLKPSGETWTWNNNTTGYRWRNNGRKAVNLDCVMS